LSSSAVAGLTAAHHSARNIYQVGRLIAQAAFLRKESRGSHLREDFTSADDANFARHLGAATGVFVSTV
jgi:L-aspartate oxidase